MTPFIPFQKIPRLSRDCVITEKLDGTNASITITPEGEFLTGSRTRWITPENDNYGFSAWAHSFRDELMKLGVGTHYGEWWGQGIQRNYGQAAKRFSLFNSMRWANDRPSCCDVVPVLYAGEFSTAQAELCVILLQEKGSAAAPGFMKPEGIIVYHSALNSYFKKTVEKDECRKSQ